MAEDTVSYWHKTAAVKKYPRLEKDIEVDNLIIGGGITGVSCAYCLGKRGEGASTVLIEADELCSGTTGNTTAKVTIQHDLIYSRLIKDHDKEFARMYAKAETEALQFIRTAVEEEKIDCNLMDNTAYIYAHTVDECADVEKEYEAATLIGIPAQLIKRPSFPSGSLYQVGFPNQAVFHPIRYVSGLAEAAEKLGVAIFCHTKAIELEDGDFITVRCENGVKIQAKNVIMATQYPFYDGTGFYFTRLYATRDYAVAVEPLKDFDSGSFKSAGKPSRSIRTHVDDDNKILIAAGEEHFTSRSEEDMAKHHDNLIDFAQNEVGVKRVIAKWSAQDYETPDGVPYIGKLTSHSHIYIASGFAAWGMTNGTLSGIIIADMITRGANRYEEVFSPSRSDIKGSVGKFVSEVGGSLGELIKSKFEPTEGIEGMNPGEGRVINFRGKRAGIYLDEDWNVTILDISCTHMTTYLNFNSAEKTWDCPAHGGRFSVDGKLLEGPPKDPLKVLYKGRYSDLIVKGKE